MVEGMYVREENVQFDDEDHNNKNSISGKAPMGANGKKNYQRPSFNRSYYRQKDENARSSTATSNIISNSTGSFRIPRKSNKWLGKDEGRQLAKFQELPIGSRFKYFLQE